MQILIVGQVKLIEKIKSTKIRLKLTGTSFQKFKWSGVRSWASSYQTGRGDSRSGADSCSSETPVGADDYLMRSIVKDKWLKGSFEPL